MSQTLTESYIGIFRLLISWLQIEKLFLMNSVIDCYILALHNSIFQAASDIPSISIHILPSNPYELFATQFFNLLYTKTARICTK